MPCVLFVSPHFPPRWEFFCRALKAEGFGLLGLGDVPPDRLSGALGALLDDYAFVPDMADTGAAIAAAEALAARHGPFHRIESHNEWWLGLDAQLRAHFGVPGLRPDDLARGRHKLGMKAVLRAAGLPTPEGEAVGSLDQLRAFGCRCGYPLILKPDQGVGAYGTMRVEREDELPAALARCDRPYLVEQFQDGDIWSFDGLTDAEGRIVFRLVHEFSQPVMDVLYRRLDFHYLSHRQPPAEIEALGPRVVAAFDVRERFFHIEFFRLRDGRFVVLEINLRPPGGFTLDMMNFACDQDWYRRWARLLAGRDGREPWEHKYHVAHVSRRADRRYRHEDDEIARAAGAGLLARLEMPAGYRELMGEWAYLLRHEERAPLCEWIALIEAQG